MITHFVDCGVCYFYMNECNIELSNKIPLPLYRQRAFYSGIRVYGVFNGIFLRLLSKVDIQYLNVPNKSVSMILCISSIQILVIFAF